jgi:hypothetical protein
MAIFEMVFYSSAWRSASLYGGAQWPAATGQGAAGAVDVQDSVCQLSLAMAHKSHIPSFAPG